MIRIVRTCAPATSRTRYTPLGSAEASKAASRARRAVGAVSYDGEGEPRRVLWLE